MPSRTPPRRGLAGLFAGLALASLGACGSEDGGPSGDGGPFMCPEAPVAYVFERKDMYTGLEGQGAALLREAGFDVRPLPLDQSPATLRGLIFLGSFVSESAEYKTYMAEHGRELVDFIDRANVIIDMSQADQTESVPPFLPSTHTATRGDDDLGDLYVFAPDNPLLAGVEQKDRKLVYTDSMAGWETFREQGGFEVILALDGTARAVALMEGAYGQGRLILSALNFDKPRGDNPARTAFAKVFAANLRTHVQNVCERMTPAIHVTPPPGGGFGFEPGSWSLAVLPDTQIYSLLYPGIFLAQTSWIGAHKSSLNIQYVLGQGDITNNNTMLEWEHARDALALLDGVLPLAIVPGNHDYGPSGDASTRDTLMNQVLSFEKASAQPTFGGAYNTGQLDNTYHLFSAGGRDLIVIALEWGPRNEVLAWASRIMDEHPDRQGILITHAYLNNNDRRYDHNDHEHPQDYNPHEYATPGGVNDGEEIWQKLVRKHKFILTLNGHVLGDGTGYLASPTDLGHNCHQVLQNYQFRDLGGEGYMRMFEFLADGKRVRVYSYSMLYDSFLIEPDQNFEFSLDLPPQNPPGP